MALAIAKFDEVNQIPQDSPIQYLAATMKEAEQLSLENETNANNSMKPIYSQQNDMLHRILVTVALVYMEYASKGVLQLTKIQKTNISKKVFNELQNDFRILGKAEVEKISDILLSTYSNTYSKSTDMLGKELNSPSQKDIKKAINKKIDGKLFSDRTWNNKDKLLKKLKKLIDDVLNGKMTIDEAGDYIKKVFGSSAKDSYRLMITEVMRAQAQGSIEAAKRLGIKRHMWNAKFENTCDYCKRMHGKIFDIDDTEAPTIPVHPYCKCIWVNIANDDTNNGNDGILNNRKWLESSFSTEKKFNKHIEKHLNQYGDITPEEYLNSARELLAAPLSDDIEGFVSEVGFIFKYRKSTNDFAVGRPDGNISTFYKPDLGLEYWKGEMNQHGGTKKV